MSIDNNKIFIVIPVYNRIQATLECLACLAEQTYQNYQIIIIDDGSTDNTETLIKQIYPNVTILKGDGNLWWTGAIYMGIEYALTKAKENDFILSLNNDVTFLPNYLEQLLTASLAYKNAVVGSLCKDTLDHSTILDSGIKIKWEKYHYYQLPFDPSKEIVTDIDTISGRGVLIPITVIKKIGNFAKNKFPHYGADYEFGFRAKKHNIPLIISNKAVVFLKNDLTGFRPTTKILSYSDIWKRLFSIKSPTNVSIHLKTIYLYCPKIYLKIFNLCYIIAGNVIVSLYSAFLYTLTLLNIIKPNPNKS